MCVRCWEYDGSKRDVKYIVSYYLVVSKWSFCCGKSCRNRILKSISVCTKHRSNPIY